MMKWYVLKVFYDGLKKGVCYLGNIEEADVRVKF